MQRIPISTVYERIDALNPRRIALITQRLNETEAYEDRVKVVSRALRNRESAFVAQLTARGIQHETFSARELTERLGEICAPGAFDLCVVAGEVCSQSVSIAANIRKAGFAGPLYLEITEEEANKKLSIDAVVANASRLNVTDLLSQFVYLTSSKRTPNAIEIETTDAFRELSIDPYPEFTRALLESYKRARTEANYNAPYFLEMLNERKGHATAIHLIHSQHPSVGFTALWER